MRRLTSQKNLEIAPSFFFMCINRSTSTRFCFFSFKQQKLLTSLLMEDITARFLLQLFQSFCVLENVGHFVCVINIRKKNEQKYAASVFVRAHMCVSHIVWSPWASALIQICFMRCFFMLFKAAPVGPRLWHFFFSPSLSLFLQYFF